MEIQRDNQIGDDLPAVRRQAGATVIDVRCPTCSMLARSSDHRLLRPLGSNDGVELRLCRNCGERLELTTFGAIAFPAG